MNADERAGALTGLARLGFSRLGDADALLAELAMLTGVAAEVLSVGASGAADPDAALSAAVRIARRDAPAAAAVLGAPSTARALWALLGASTGFADFYLRQPGELRRLEDAGATLPDAAALHRDLLDAVGAHGGFAARGDETAWNALRVRYRRMLALIAAYDLLHPDPVQVLPEVAAALADAAGAALEASLAVARTRVCTGAAGGLFPRAQVAATRLAVIGMGKTGARELNYVSDVDVIFVGGVDDTLADAPPLSRAVDIATRLAVQTMRGLSGAEAEPALWEVDANLRPEGRQGALVRTLESHLSYYDRWAKSWEFQALLKARPIAGDPQLGQDYIDAVAPKVWSSAARADFVDSVQRMRERVTEHIPEAEVAYQLKLGPGGIRDVEFTVQLLQLVHGLSDPAVRQRGTLEALDALVVEGYIGRADAAVFARDYRVLRVLEHRVQLVRLARTHLMPADDDGRRVLARASRLADGAAAVWELWERIKREVRDIHVRLFYRPLLSAVASLGPDERALSADQAHDRLAAIGFGDPAGALRHIAALTGGLSRKAAIQRHLMPVMIRWFADGVDPDEGLLTFRRISERLGDRPWFLRLLRDSSGAAERLSHALAGSRYVGALMEWTPESVAWLDDPQTLRPRTGEALQEEARAIQTRHTGVADAMRAVRALRRRELLRTAMASLVDGTDLLDAAATLSTIAEVTLQAALRAVRHEVVPHDADALQFAIIGMGRLGGSEIGFGSDADVLYVYDANGVEPQRAATIATAIVAALRRHSEDHRAPLELDADLRPEGRRGPVVRSLDAYAEYYRRWSVSWEAQALLRARGIAGSTQLIARFTALADEVRYPTVVDPQGLREIKRIKARVENERLPQGVDRARHLKLGPGGLSDVEWLVQLLQLQHGHRLASLRTPSTLAALAAASDAGLIPDAAAGRLHESWQRSSRLRSANTLLTGRTSDILPTDRRALDGIGRILGYPPRSATRVEEDFLAAARRSRRSFEKLFYG